MLEIKQGKLYQDGKEIKPEVGNKDHIKLLREHGMYHHEPELTPEELKEIEDDGIDLEVRAEIIVRTEFTCVCGREVKDEFEDFEMDFDERDLEEEELSCSCGREYKVTGGGEKVRLVKP